MFISGRLLKIYKQIKCALFSTGAFVIVYSYIYLPRPP